MPLPAADVRRAARVFKALAHPHRVQLACCLSGGRSRTQKELVAELGLPQSTVARHLGQLREHGLIRATRNGAEVELELEGTVTPRLLEVVCRWVHPETGDHFTAGERRRFARSVHATA